MLILLIKLFAIIFLAILIPLYWKTYGLDNFLWLSDIGLFLTVFGIVFSSPLLISMAAVGVFVFESIWAVDYFYQLFTHKPLLKVSDYMFEPQYNKFVRALSLFHIVVLILWIVLLIKWGYDPRALYFQILLTWIVLLLCYFLTSPSNNVNWVFMPKQNNWKMPSLVWLGILLVGIPVLFQIPLHFIFINIFHII